MNNVVKKIFIAIGIVCLIAITGLWGYTVISFVSPAAKEKVQDISLGVKGVLSEETEDTDVDNDIDLPLEDEVTEDDRGTGDDFTYMDQNTRSYEGPEIYQVMRYVYNTDGKMLENFRDGDRAYLYMTKNVDSSEAVLTYDDKCYYIDADLNVTEIADDVVVSGMCYNGGYFYYVVEKEEYKCELYIYDVAAGQATVVATGPIYSCCISPNGRTVAYFTHTSDMKLFVSGLDIEDHAGDRGHRYSPLTVSDDGETIFYTAYDEGSETYCWNRGETVQLTKDYAYHCCFDRECKQIIFTGPEGVGYFRAGDSEKTVLSTSRSEDFIISKVKYQRIEGFSYDCILDTDCFADVLMYEQGDICYALRGKVPEAVNLTHGEEQVLKGNYGISAEGPTLYYREKEKLIKVVYDGKNVTTETVFSGQSIGLDYACSGDLNEVWVYDSKKLYYLANGKSPVMLVESGSIDSYRIDWRPDDGMLYYVKSKCLYRIGSTSESEEMVYKGCEGLEHIVAERKTIGFEDKSDNVYMLINNEVVAE